MVKNEDKKIIFCSCSSGSSGNSYVVATDNATILVDAGTTGKNMIAGLNKCGLTPGDVDGIFLTHEHHDHVRGLPVIIKEINKAKVALDARNPKASFKIYGSAGTIAATEQRLFGKTELSDASIIDSPLEINQIGDLKITAFRLSHDAAEPYGFRFDAYGKSLAVVTDTGYVPDSIFRSIKDVDFLVLEANHEKNILLMGRYPYELKMRILGDYGHLSNETAGEALTEILDYRNGGKPRGDGFDVNREMPEAKAPLNVALAHLSKDNNTPDMALVTITNILFEEGYIRDKDYTLEVLERDTVGKIFEI